MSEGGGEEEVDSGSSSEMDLDNGLGISGRMEEIFSGRSLRSGSSAREERMEIGNASVIGKLLV
jgi:hypothetical protein